MDEKPSYQFCALEYSPEGRVTGSSPEHVIILLLRSINGDLNVLADPEWHSIVVQTDRSYIREIVSDFKTRAHFDPEGLLKQAKSLSVGPLITHAEGPDIAQFPILKDLAERFVNAGELDLSGSEC
jgi:hypothetical protein